VSDNWQIGGGSSVNDGRQQLKFWRDEPERDHDSEGFKLFKQQNT
jgi:hypothetical protein